MSKLEVEYDYDTDNEQLTHSHNMLLRELFQAIEFFVKEDPLKLVENVRLWVAQLWTNATSKFSNHWSPTLVSHLSYITVWFGLTGGCSEMDVTSNEELTL